MIESKLDLKDIPDGAYVNCPKAGEFKEVFFKTHCPDCEHFKGLEGIEEAIKRNLPFKKCYKLKCHMLMLRSIGVVE